MNDEPSNVMLQAIILVVAQTIVLLGISPFLVGLIRKVKARLQCRRGAGVFQPYADLAKLFRKQPVVSTTTSWIFPPRPTFCSPPHSLQVCSSPRSLPRPP